MATTKSKLPSPGTGGGSITDDLLKIGNGLARTAGKIYRAVVGPQQEQTYGWTSQFFPSGMRSERKQKTSVQNFPTGAPQNLGPVPAMGMDTEEILNLMKENYADEKRYREVQKGFAEERADEEEKRHKELVTALKKFTGTKATATVVEKKEEGGGFLDMLKSLYDSLAKKVEDWIAKLAENEILKKPMEWLSKAIGGLFTAPFLLASGIAFAMGAALIGLQLFELRNLEELGGEEAAQLGGERQTEEMLGAMDSGAFGAAIMNANEETKSDKIKKLIRTKQETMAALLEPEGYTVASVNGEGRFVFENDKGKRPPKELYDMVSAQANLMMRQGKSLSPKDVRSQLTINDYDVPMPEIPTDIYKSDYMSPEEASKAAFGVRPHGIKAAPVPPPPTPVAQLTDMNRDLEMYTSPMGDIGGPIIQQSNTQSAQNEPPIPSTATQRDEEQMAAHVFRTQRRRARAY